jgi:hypothetical protein
MAVIAPPLSGAVFGRAPEQAVSTPNTAMLASANVNQPRLDLPEIRFMIINLATGCENRQRRSKEPYPATDFRFQAETSGLRASPTSVMTPGV